MNDFYVDLHIHIGRTATGKPVKITGSKTLTLENIIKEAAQVKGLNMIGIIDCHSPEVIAEFERLIDKGIVEELSEGGLRYKNVVVIPGSEIEIYDRACQGALHVLAYLPTLRKMKRFSVWLAQHMKNIQLSSQRFYGTGRQLQDQVKDMGGLFIPAHVFTPHKGLYGKGVKKTLTEVFDPDKIDAVELGLSANTEMADQIPELHNVSFLSHSDAHSLAKIAREYEMIRMKQPSFSELVLAVHHEDGREVRANYGLDPRLGKYHRTMCEQCYEVIEDNDVKSCPVCGNKRITMGVYDRLQQLKEPVDNTPERPPYIHQVPLEFIPKLGPKTLQKLRDVFGTEMNILHNASESELKNVVSKEVTNCILQARHGELSIRIGGAGRYGKVK
jgi:uncharacterized protein (TIGR00375 family)